MSIVSPKIWYLCSEYAITCRCAARLSQKLQLRCNQRE
jgi:hypothetical protein